MRIHIGCQFNYDLPQPTPMILLLNVHFSRSGDLERPDMLVPSPAVPVQSYRDGFGNWCSRLVAPPGASRFRPTVSSATMANPIRSIGQPFNTRLNTCLQIR